MGPIYYLFVGGGFAYATHGITTVSSRRADMVRSFSLRIGGVEPRISEIISKEA